MSPPPPVAPVGKKGPMGVLWTIGTPFAMPLVSTANNIHFLTIEMGLISIILK